MIVVRHMVPQDAEAVSALLAESWQRTYGPLIGQARTAEANAARHTPERLAAEAADDDVVAFVAVEEDGRITGHAMAEMDEGGQAWLERLHLSQDKYGSGLADDLLRAVLAAHSGLSSIALEVIEGNERAIAFYQKHGFIVAERKNACGEIDDVPTLVMKKLLPRA